MHERPETKIDTFTGITGREKDSFHPRAVGSFKNREEGHKERR